MSAITVAGLTSPERNTPVLITAISAWSLTALCIIPTLYSAQTATAYTRVTRNTNSPDLSLLPISVSANRCPNCKHLVSRREEHKCLANRCRICGAERPPHSDINSDQHLCYIRRLEPEIDHVDGIFFNDFETFVNREGVHVHYLVCTISLVGEEWNAYGLDCVQKFVQKFRKKRHREATFIAHNAKTVT